MGFNRTQKKYIKKNISTDDVESIASKLDVPSEDILKYLRDIWNEEKYQKFLDRITQDKLAYSKQTFDLPTLISWIKDNKIVLILITVLVFCVYANGLGNEFTSDSKTGILLNPNIGNIRYVITHPTDVILMLTRYLLFKVGGTSPWIYRIVNIFAHAGSSLFIYFFISKIHNKKAGLFSSLLFSVHPILVESVTWIAGSPYSISTFLFLIAFVNFSLFKKKFSYITILLFIFAVLTSDKVFVYSLIFLFYEISFGNIRKFYKPLLSVFGVSLLYLFLILRNISIRIESSKINYGGDNMTSNIFVQIPIAVTEYFKLIFWPKALTLYHSEMSFGQGEYLFRLGLLLVFIGIIVFSYFRARGGLNKSFKFWLEPDESKTKFKFTQNDYKYIFFWFSFFLIALSPTLTPFGISWIVAERYVYLGSVGIFAVIGLVLSKLVQKENLRSYVYIIFGIIILSLSIRTIARNRDWKNEDTLWLATAEVSPSSSQNHNNLGDYYGRQGDIEKSAEEFKRAIELKPDYSDAYHNLANTYTQIAMMKAQNENEEGFNEYILMSIQNYEKALSFNPNLWQSYQNLAIIYFNMKDFEKASQNLIKAIEINSKNFELTYNLGIVYMQMGENEKAKEAFLSVLEVDQNNKEATQMLTELQKK